MQNGSIETRPGFNRFRRRSPEDAASFHAENEIKSGREKKAADAAEKGTVLMIKNPWGEGVITNEEFDEHIAKHGRGPIKETVEIEPID